MNTQTEFYEAKNTTTDSGACYCNHTVRLVGNHPGTINFARRPEQENGLHQSELQ